MNIKGVSDNEYKIIKNILYPFKEKYDFFLYGSRTKDNFRKLSDLDILVKSDKEINLDDIETIKNLFDNSNIPYIINLTNFNNISKDFYELIEKDLKKIEF